MQGTGLNRHRRGYAIKEAASGVHFQDVGSYRARLVSYFNINFIIIINIRGSIILEAREYQKYSTSIGSIALSRAVVPINTSLSGISRNLGKTSPTHATRYQTMPINLMHKYSSNCKT